MTDLDLHPATRRVDVRPATRSVGVEEELLLVDPHDGHAVPLARELLGSSTTTAAVAGTQFGALQAELQQQQVETATPPRTRLVDVAADLRGRRRLADALARSVGARVAALATS